MVSSKNCSSRFPRSCSAVALLFILGGCDRNASEVSTLRAENDRLRAELAQLRRKPGGAKESESQPGKPDMILGINELWTQRFEDNEFRAKQRLTDKIIRVTGLVDGVSGGTISLFGAGKSGRSVRMGVRLDPAYADRIQGGLASLEKGSSVTVQGKFAFERMGLEESTFVDKATGKTLSPEEMLALAQAGAVKSPSPSDPEK